MLHFKIATMIEPEHSPAADPNQFIQIKTKPAVWKMVKEAVEALGGATTNIGGVSTG